MLSQVHEGKIRALVKETQNLSVEEISYTLIIPRSTLHDHLKKKKMGMTLKLKVSIPHGLSERNWFYRMTVCISLLARIKSESFLKHLITGDEKWILYHNPQRKKYRTEKGEQRQRRAKLDCIFARFLYVFGGIIKGSYILIYDQ